MRNAFIVLMLFFSCTTMSWAGPFGTNMGDAKDKFSNLEKKGADSDNVYTTGVMPKKHSDFMLYDLVIPSQHGLVKITAFSSPIENDSYGDKTRGLFKKVLTQIREKYGKEKNNFDFLHAGSIWKEEKYWMEGIKRGERTYSAFWDIKDNEDKITNISLSVFAINNFSCVVLSYEYENADTYFKEKESKDAGAL